MVKYAQLKISETDIPAHYTAHRLLFSVAYLTTLPTVQIKILGVANETQKTWKELVTATAYGIIPEFVWREWGKPHQTKTV